jgi:hypothetical protein
MTRREEIQQAILENGIDYCEEHPEMNLSIKEAFVMGAVWADKTMIDKATQWLFENVYDYLNPEDQERVESFRKAMEE